MQEAAWVHTTHDSRLTHLDTAHTQADHYNQRAMRLLASSSKALFAGESWLGLLGCAVGAACWGMMGIGCVSKKGVCTNWISTASG